MKTIALMMVFLTSVLGMNAQSEGLQNFKKTDKEIKAEFFHANGNLAQVGTYNLKNQLHGLWTSYDESGMKLSQGHYSNGRKVGLWTFFQNEKLVLVEFDNSKIVQVTDLTISNNPVVTRYDKD